MVLYDQALDACEVEAVAQRLTDKYQLPFQDTLSALDALKGNFDGQFGGEFEQDLAGLYHFQTVNCADPSISTHAQSDILKVLQSEVPDEGEYLLFGHNGQTGVSTQRRGYGLLLPTELRYPPSPYLSSFRCAGDSG